MGSGNFSVRYIDSQKNKLVESIGVARGKLRSKGKKQWVKADKYMIISKRDYGDKFVDIIYVYDPEYVSELKKN